MRSRMLASMGAVALTLGGLLVSASPAAADPAHCYGWNTHPDLYTAGGIKFKDGTPIRRGPYKECDAFDLGRSGHGIDVHCAVINSYNVAWVFVRDTTTDTAGWVRLEHLDAPSVGITLCG